MTIGRYIRRDMEDSLVNDLVKGNRVALVGLSGGGKTSLLKFVALKLIEKGFVPILIKQSQDPNLKPYLRIEQFPDEDAHFSFVPELIMPERYLFVGTEFSNLFLSVCKTLENELSKGDIDEAAQRVIKDLDLQESLAKNVRVSGKANQLILSSSTIVSTLLHTPLITAVLISATACDMIFNLLDPKGDPNKPKKLKQMDGFNLSINGNTSRIVLIFDDLKEPTSNPGFVPLLNIRYMDSLVKTFSSLFAVSIDEDDTIDYLADKLNWLEWLPSLHSEREIYTLPSPDKIKLTEILNANIQRPNSTMVSKVVELTDEPALALMLYEMNLKDSDVQALVQEMKNSRYTEFDTLESIDDKKKKDELVRDNLMRRHRISATLYNKIRKRNFALCALIAQPYGLSVSNIDSFCKATKSLQSKNGLNCFPKFTGQDANFAHIEDGPGVGGTVVESKFCVLNELWDHLVGWVEYMCSKNFDFKINEVKHIPGEIAEIRKTLIKILDEDAKSTAFFKQWKSFPILYHSYRLYDYYGRLGDTFGVSIRWLLDRVVFWLPSFVNDSSDLSEPFVLMARALYKASTISPQARVHMIKSEMAVIQAQLAFRAGGNVEDTLEEFKQLLQPTSKDKSVKYVSCIATAYLFFKLYEVVSADTSSDLYSLSLSSLQELESENSIASEFTKAKMYTLIGYITQKFHTEDQMTLGRLASALVIQQKILNSPILYAKDPVIAEYLFPSYTKDKELAVSHEALNDMVLVLNSMGCVENLNQNYKEGQSHISDSWRIYENKTIGNDNINVEDSKIDYVDFEIVEHGLGPEQLIFLRKLYSDVDNKYGERVPINTLEAILIRLAFAERVLNDTSISNHLNRLRDGLLLSLLLGANYIYESSHNKNPLYDKTEILDRLSGSIRRDESIVRSVGDQLIFSKALLNVIKGDYTSAVSLCRNTGDLHPLTKKLFSQFADQLEANGVDSNTFNTFVKLYFLAN